MIDELLTFAEAQMPLVISILAGVVLLGSLLGFLIGRSKDRPMLGVFLGGLLPVPGLVAIWLMPQKEGDFY